MTTIVALLDHAKVNALSIGELPALTYVRLPRRHRLLYFLFFLLLFFFYLPILALATIAEEVDKFSLGLTIFSENVI